LSAICFPSGFANKRLNLGNSSTITLVEDSDVVKRLESRSPIRFSRKRQDLRPFSTQLDRGSVGARRSLFVARDPGQCSVPPLDHLVGAASNRRAVGEKAGGAADDRAQGD
jgi:hypothetical protein